MPSVVLYPVLCSLLSSAPLQRVPFVCKIWHGSEKRAESYFLVLALFFVGIPLFHTPVGTVRQIHGRPCSFSYVFPGYFPLISLGKAK